MTRNALLIALAAFTLFHIAGFCMSAIRLAKAGHPWRPSLAQLAIGFGTNFFDTLGIGSFAPTTSLFRFFKLVPDEKIPGTLNVGHTIPAIMQAFVFISIVEVESLTLVALIAAAVIGGWIGAERVCHWPKRAVQRVMGLALAVAAGFFVARNLNLLPEGGAALGLHDIKLAIGTLGNGFLGALMAAGIGLFAPCMVLVSVLGMTPGGAFPIMMGSCAFLMPVASRRFMKSDCFDLAASLGLTLGGIPAVLLAAFIVKSLDVTTLRWGVSVVILYTAVTLLRDGFGKPRGGR